MLKLFEETINKPKRNISPSRTQKCHRAEKIRVSQRVVPFVSTIGNKKSRILISVIKRLGFQLRSKGIVASLKEIGRIV